MLEVGAGPGTATIRLLALGADPLGAFEDVTLSAGAFDVVDARIATWSLELDASQTVDLYATFSNVTVRPDREAVLAELGRIAREEFGGRVVRNMTTSLVLGRRTG